MPLRFDIFQCRVNIVEMDDAFFGAPNEGGKRGRGTKKTPAVIGLSLDEEGRPEHLKIRVPRAWASFKRKRLSGMPMLRKEMKCKSMPYPCCEGW
jgi:hypothetical protein